MTRLLKRLLDALCGQPNLTRNSRSRALRELLAKEDAMTDKQDKAGRELDALVAEKVMGWTDRVIKTETCYPSFDVTATPPNWGETGARYHRVPDYSTDIAAAWLVVDQLMAGDWTVTLAFRQFEKFPEDRFHFHGCRMAKKPQRMHAFSGHGETAPLAICLAALKAMEVSQ